MKKKYKIVLTGPESTAKSTLCKYLSEKFNTICLYEYAREYVSKLDREYNYSDLEIIARKIFELEDEYENKCDNFFFVDTSVIIMKVWFEVVYKKIPQWFSARITEYFADFYLLMKHDLPWIPDPLRENPGEMRQKLFYIYKNELDNFGLNYAIIGGVGEERQKNAYKAVENFLIKKNVKVI